MHMLSKRCLIPVMFGAAMLVASNVHAVTIADVGSVDEFLASAAQGSPELHDSGEGTEEGWIAGVLGVTTDDIDYAQLENSGAAAWSLVEGTTSVYAFNFATFGITDPALFLVKIGNSANSDQTHILYTNKPSLQYGVIDLSNFGDGFVLENIGKVSHVGTVDGESEEPPPAVPEPASLLLLGTGLAAVASRARRRT